MGVGGPGVTDPPAPVPGVLLYPPPCFVWPLKPGLYLPALLLPSFVPGNPCQGILRAGHLSPAGSLMSVFRDLGIQA